MRKEAVAATKSRKRIFNVARKEDGRKQEIKGRNNMCKNEKNAEDEEGRGREHHTNIEYACGSGLGDDEFVV